MALKFVVNGLLLIATLALSLLVLEWVARQFFPPIDFLMAELERDPLINHRIKPGSAGHDKWGFRNESVPEAVDILAIGDSMTYGVAATHLESWPTHLAQLTGRSVYNMGLGGYGPMHYLSLLQTKAATLNPSVVVVSVYLGNDIMDAYNLVYSNDFWVEYRTQNALLEQVDPGSLVEVLPTGKRLLGGARDWLARTSVIYRVITQSSLGNFVRDAEVNFGNDSVIRLAMPGGYTYMTPDRRFVALDLENPSIQEGVELTLRAIDLMIDECKESSTSLVVTLVPTKELVLEEFVLEQGNLPEDSKFLQLAANERAVKARLVSHLEDRGVHYVDLLARLRKAAQVQAVYPPNDGHPNGAGYRAIAQAVAEVLKEHSL